MYDPAATMPHGSQFRPERRNTMKKLDHVRRAVSVLLLCVSLTLCGCSEGEQPENSDTSSAIEESVDVTATETKESEGETIEEVPIDYGNAESFEAALDAGENLEGKVVQFVVKEFHPDSQLGYDIWAGEHLNFISTDNPEVQENDTVTAKVSKVSNLLGSWIINYENVENGIVTEDTITSPQTNESGDPDTSSEEDEGTYDNNANYDIVETASIKNSIGSTTIIHKVLAKKDVSVSGTILAYAADGSVIGKSTDYIFPMYNIGFIALNDGIDTLNSDSTNMDMMPIRNVLTNGTLPTLQKSACSNCI